MKARVANRVTEILESSEPSDWRHVAGTINPADLLTRGVSNPEKLMVNRWFVGPEFLEKYEDEWPTTTIPDLDEDDENIKKKPLFTAATMIDIEDVETSKISTWRRLLRVAAYALRFIKFVRCSEARTLNDFTVTEMKDAEEMVVKDIQKDQYEDEI